MTADEFRKLALLQPEAVEGRHQGHPDFRVGGRIFATLGPRGDWAMVKVPLDLQSMLVTSDPAVFEPMAGTWGSQGCTRVELSKAPPGLVSEALVAAWKQAGPR